MQLDQYIDHYFDHHLDRHVEYIFIPSTQQNKAKGKRSLLGAVFRTEVQWPDQRTAVA